MIARYHAGDEIERGPGSHDAPNERKHAPSGMSARSPTDQKPGRGGDRQCGERIVSDGLYPVPASPPPTQPRCLLRPVHGMSVRIHVS
jgi:hypothetical protein